MNVNVDSIVESLPRSLQVYLGLFLNDDTTPHMELFVIDAETGDCVLNEEPERQLKMFADNVFEAVCRVKVQTEIHPSVSVHRELSSQERAIVATRFGEAMVALSHSSRRVDARRIVHFMMLRLAQS